MRKYLVIEFDDNDTVIDHDVTGITRIEGNLEMVMAGDLDSCVSSAFKFFRKHDSFFDRADEAYSLTKES